MRTQKLFVIIQSIVILIATLTEVFAQEAKHPGIIKGIVLDSTTQKPVPYVAIVLLKDTRPVGGSLTDEKGKFKIKNVPSGKIELKIEAIGYKTYLQNIALTKERPTFFVKIELAPKDVKLKEVEIVGEKELVETHIDKIVYNAEDDVGTEGGDATDVLRKTPLLSVDADGNVSIRGNSGVRIFINGKPSLLFDSNPNDALKALPADQIAKVEVITSPSAKYEGEGTAGIVNIILKKNTIVGKAGSFSLGGGDIYGFGNMNVGIKTQKLTFQLNAGGRYRYAGDGYNKFYRKQDSVELFQEGEFFPRRGGGYFDFSTEYEIDSAKTFQVSLTSNLFNSIRESDVRVFGTNRPEYHRYSLNPSTSYTFGVSPSYSVETKKYELSILGNWQREHSVRNYSMTQDDPLNILDLQELGDNVVNSDRTEFQTDYKKIFSEGKNLETGIKIIRRDFLSDNVYKQDSSLSENYKITRQDKFDFLQSIYAAYVQYKMPVKEKFQITFGTRYEFTRNKSLSNDTLSATQEYHNLLPNISLGYRLKKMRMLKLSYSMRINRPFIRRLNPYVNASDPRALQKGNPDLIPTKTHRIEFGLFPELTLFGSYTQNIITDYTVILDSFTTLTYPINAGYSYNYGISSFLMKHFFKRKLQLLAFSSISMTTLHYQNITNSGLQYYLMLNATYTLRRFVTDVGIYLSSPRITIQGFNTAFSMINIGARYYLNKKRTFSLGLRVTNPHLKYFEFVYTTETPAFYQQNINGVYFRQIALSLKYRFGNFRLKEKRGGMSEEREIY